MKKILGLILALVTLPAFAATDDFSATNSPLASPWTAVGYPAALRSTGGAAAAITANTDSAMIYSTATGTCSQITVSVAGDADSGPALLKTDGDGYLISAAGGTMTLYEMPGFASRASAAATYAPGSVVKICQEGTEVVGYFNSVEKWRWNDATPYSMLVAGMFFYDGDSRFADWTDLAGGGGGGVKVNPISGRGGAAAQPIVTN